MLPTLPLLWPERERSPLFSDLCCGLFFFFSDLYCALFPTGWIRQGRVEMILLFGLTQNKDGPLLNGLPAGCADPSSGP